MFKKVQVVSFLDISKRPPDLNEEHSKNSSRIMATEDDDDINEADGDHISSKRLLKLILRDETGNLIIAVEHEPESVPLRIQEGTWMLLDYSKIEFMQSVAFLRKGALYQNFIC